MTSGADPHRERLYDLFLEELDERVEDLHVGLEQFVASGLPSSETEPMLETLFRAAHSLKGAAQAVGASAVADICHELEDLLSEVRDGARPPDAPLLSRMSGAVDTIVEAGRALRPPGSAIAARRDAWSPPPDSRQPDPGAPEQPAGALPVDFGVTTGRGRVRLAGQTFDALMARGSDVISATYRAEHMVRDLAETRDALADAAREQRHDLRVLAEKAGAPHDGAVMAAVATMDGRLRDITNELERLARTAAAQQRALRAAVDGFEETAQHARSVPFTDAVAGLSRIVRELAEQSGKQAELIVEAEDVEVDRTLVATLHDVLGHLVRNAVDHGLEPPPERERAGKRPVGSIKVSATLISNGIEVAVADDGCGVVADRVRRAAEDLGLVSEDESILSLEKLVFHPGLTTTAEVNRFSGRGVGLDAVRAQVEGVGGTVTLESEPGSGTVVRMIVPLLLSKIRVVTARVGDDVVAFPSSAVRTVATVPAARPSGAGREVVTVGGETLAGRRASELLGWDHAADPEVGAQVSALVLEAGAEAVAVIVDEFLSEREILLRSAPPRLAGASLLLGTTQLENGTVGLVLSPGACVRSALTHQRVARPSEVEPSAAPQILLVEDTVTTRELERSILELAGYSVHVATDGAHAWQLLRTHHFDAVVSDVDMPRMDGVALCRAIRSSRELAELPVILVTSLHSDADRRRGLDAGADAYLSKTGFDRGALLEALEALL